MSRRLEFVICFFFAALYFILNVQLYPPIYAIHDEAAYMAQAYVMREGTIFGDVAGIQVVSSVETESGHYVTKYAPGMSALLVPFTFLGWKFIFLVPLLLHLLGFYIFRKILELRKIPPVFSLLYLIYPTSILYSRTLMADIPSAVFFLIAIYFYLRDRNWMYFSGFFLGIIPLFRYSNIILSFPFFLVSFINMFSFNRGKSRDRLGFLKLIIGFLPGVALLLLYNRVAFGGFLNTSLGATGTFSAGFLPGNLLFYIISLTLIFPFMFFSIFFEKKDRLLFWLCVFGVMFFYSCYYYFTVAPGGNMLRTLVVGMRFLLPIMPIFLLTYAGAINWLQKRMRVIPQFGFWTIIVGFSLLALGMVLQHQKFLKKQEQYKNCIYENTDGKSLILTNYDGMEFFQPAWGKRQYTLFVYWKNRIPIEFTEYEFENLFLLTVIRSDKEGNEYVREYAQEIIDEYDGEIVKEIPGDPELRLWKLTYPSDKDSVSGSRSTGISENSSIGEYEDESENGSSAEIQGEEEWQRRGK